MNIFYAMDTLCDANCLNLNGTIHFVIKYLIV